MSSFIQSKSIISPTQVEKCIYLIHGHKVMIDSDLAHLYDVETGGLNRAMKRNPDRFPKDFCFQLSQEEYNSLRCQNGISKAKGGRRYLPYVFTEQGIAMLSSVLKSNRAILVNVQIMRTFVQLREILISNKDLARKLENLEKKYDHQFKAVFDAIREIMTPPKNNQKFIGFKGR